MGAIIEVCDIDTDTDTDTDTGGGIMTILWNVINSVVKWINAHNCETT